MSPDVNVVRSKNIYERKDAMTAALRELNPDAKHFKGYMYFSIHAVEAAVAKAAHEVGVDVTVDVVPEGDNLTAVVTLTCIDGGAMEGGFQNAWPYALTQRFAARNLPEDPANSYLVKYAYVRLFHMADQEDADLHKDAPRAAKANQAPSAAPTGGTKAPRQAPQPQASNGGAPANGVHKELLTALAKLPDEERKAIFAREFNGAAPDRALIEVLTEQAAQDLLIVVTGE